MTEEKTITVKMTPTQHERFEKEQQVNATLDTICTAINQMIDTMLVEKVYYDKDTKEGKLSVSVDMVKLCERITSTGNTKYPIHASFRTAKIFVDKYTPEEAIKRIAEIEASKA